MTSFILNRHEYSTQLSPGSSTLDLIRRGATLTGTKEGCRDGDCGACTVLLGIPGADGIRYMAVNSCLLPVGELRDRHLVTVEGLCPGNELTIVQRFLAENGASQCGFCTPGIVMSLTGYFLSSLHPDPDGAITALGGNICRCTGYVSIRKTAALLCTEIGDSPAGSCSRQKHVEWLVDRGVLPDYFTGIPGELEAIEHSSGRTGVPSDRAHIQMVAGGTDLFATRAEELRTAELRFLCGEAGLSGIGVERGICTIGAASTVSDIIGSGVFDGISSFGKVFRLISSTQIRNRATIGGNIVNASPIGDLSVILLALDSSLTISDGIEERNVSLRDFFMGYRIIDLEPGEFLKEVFFRLPVDGVLFNFEKVSMREHMDIASVNSAALLEMDGNTIRKASFSAGGIAPVPLFLSRTSGIISGRELSPETVVLACETARSEAAAIDDVRGSAAYKILLLGRLITAHFTEIFNDILPLEDLL